MKTPICVSGLVLFLSASVVVARADVVCREAETGVTSGQWKVTEDPWAAKGRCVDGLVRAGGLAIELEIKQPGAHYVWARIFTSRGFKVACDGRAIGQMNPQPEAHWGGYVGQWSWCGVADRSGIRGVELSAGKHVLTFSGDEAGRIDRVLVMPLSPVKGAEYRLGPSSTERTIAALSGTQHYDFLMVGEDGNLVPGLKYSDGQGRCGAFPAWSMIGPFPDGVARKGFRSAFGPEKELRFDAQYESHGRRAKWEKAPEQENAAALARCCADMAALGLLERQDYEKAGEKPLPGWIMHFDDAAMGAATKTFYVAVDGHDANPGTEAQPWRTLVKAAATLTAGQRVLVKAGVYAADRETPPAIVPENPGRPGAYIHYQAAAGASVTLKGIAFHLEGLRSSYTHLQGFRFERGGIEGRYLLSHVVVDDCELTNRSRFCFNGQEMVVRRVRVHGNQDGLGLCHSHSVLVEDSLFDNNQNVYGSTAYENNNTDGINAAGGATKIVIRRCVMARAGDGGVDLKCNLHPGLQVVIEDSVAYENLHYGFKIWNPESRLINCVAAWNNWANCDGLYDLYNCTIVGCGRSKHKVAFVPGNRGRTVVNCIFANCDVDADTYLAAKTSNNLLFQAGEAKLQRPSASDLIGDPLFVDPDKGDFRLKPGSPALGAGNPEGAPANDITGAPRKDKPDVGAYQSGDATFIKLEPGQKGDPLQRRTAQPSNHR